MSVLTGKYSANMNYMHILSFVNTDVFCFPHNSAKKKKKLPKWDH